MAGEFTLPPRRFGKQWTVAVATAEVDGMYAARATVSLEALSVAVLQGVG